MARDRILLCLLHLSGNEMKFIQEAFDDNWVLPLGPNVNAFEEELREFLLKKDPVSEIPPSINSEIHENPQLQVVALASGTAAVHLGLIGAGVKAEDEVMVQSFTFCASSNPIVYLGAKPVFVDSERDTWNMDPELLDQAIADRIEKTGKKPAAIVPVHLYGMPANMNAILRVAAKYDIPVVEDAAEGFGSEYCGQKCGTFGCYGVLSFNGNKMITTSGGGALVCPDAAAKKEAMFYSTQARESYPYYQHQHIGYNYRMSNICAGIGRGQMTVLEEHITHHRRLEALYADLLRDFPGITLHRNPSPEYNSNFWLNTVLIDPDLEIEGQENAYKEVVTRVVGGAAGTAHIAHDLHTDCEPNANVEAMRMALERANIESRPLWKPLHRQPVYSNAVAYVNGVSEDLFHRGLCLPSGPQVSEDDVRYIVDTMRKAVVSNHRGEVAAGS